MARILAIDYGRARIGLALSDPLGISVRPLPALKARDPKQDVAALRDLATEEEVDRILLGMPYRLDGSEGEAVMEVRSFRTALESALDLPIEEIDERLSSKQAHATLKSAGVSHRRRKELVDSSAAVILLQTYLAGQRGKSE